MQNLQPANKASPSPAMVITSTPSDMDASTSVTSLGTTATTWMEHNGGVAQTQALDGPSIAT